ncbi:hypothetical protein DRH29_02825 [candidate division Kazan bacterium]|uniref:Uncharacterized protein n=1 Tax=candidate division Kazan bacterium TaxID=2202143 RepID=A0A420ZCB7_UNCK3|nr:MAG: hypothetical protein DRH29_02825 [candidate division Kazan bacterium]
MPLRFIRGEPVSAEPELSSIDERPRWAFGVLDGMLREANELRGLGPSQGALLHIEARHLKIVADVAYPVPDKSGVWDRVCWYRVRLQGDAWPSKVNKVRDDLRQVYGRDNTVVGLVGVDPAQRELVFGVWQCTLARGRPIALDDLILSRLTSGEVWTLHDAPQGVVED